ncbi:Roadblock/LAMTOR2 domain-containing protein [Entamoeba marina]
MLNVKALHNILESMISVNIQQVIVANTQGSILAYVGKDIEQAEAITSILSRIWDTTIEETITQFENGPIYQTHLSNDLYIIVIGSAIAHIGMLVQRTNAIKNTISSSLQEFILESK